MAGAKLTPRQIMLLAALVSFDIDLPTIAWVIEISEVTVRYWQRKFLALERVGA